MNLLIFVGHTIDEKTRSGIQRVVVEVSIVLASNPKVSFVKWDTIDGQLRFLNRVELHNLLPDLSTTKDLVKLQSAAVNYRFNDLLPKNDNNWLLFPEVPYLMDNGIQVYERIHSQCRENHIHVASVFYDLIPILDQDYYESRTPHQKYVAELSRSELIFAISEYSAMELKQYYSELAVFSDEELEDLQSRIIALPLGEYRAGEAKVGIDLQSKTVNPSMIMVGSIEPRKQQTRLLRVLNESKHKLAELNLLEVEIFGSLHPDSSAELWDEVSKNPNIRYHSYSSDEQIEAAYRKAWFSAFPSRYEGYGLPIVESLHHGIPCLTSNFGAMSEVAHGGGCLMVDTTSDQAIADALADLSSKAQLRTNLTNEIKDRTSRSWENYAEDLIAELEGFDSRENEANLEIEVGIASALENQNTKSRKLVSLGLEWNIIVNPTESSFANREAGTSLLISKVKESINVQDPFFETVSNSDLVVFEKQQDLENLVRGIKESSYPYALPNLIFQESIKEVVSEARRLGSVRTNAQKAARRDRLRSKILGKFQATESNATLAIVISTFNRGPFVEENVKWVLKLINNGNLNVKCIVVDNTSTDGTRQRLGKYLEDPKFEYVCNSANVGMLGNLHVCSTLHLADYIWVIGDDDFINPGALEKTLSAIESNPGISLLFHNFQVYFREQLTESDSPEIFFREAQILGVSSRRDGVYPVNMIADAHDNLFTAIYPIVFRSDCLAACFNYPFNGTPFVDLVESVPTTKIILTTYRYHSAYWFQEPGITGNAHNSWSSHRPRWHLVLMPLVFELARDAGVDPEKIWNWSEVHLPLFYEACERAIENDHQAHLEDSEILNAHLFFREEIQVPELLDFTGNPNTFSEWHFN